MGRRLAAALALLFALAACGGAGGGAEGRSNGSGESAQEGSAQREAAQREAAQGEVAQGEAAQLWVTRDRGREVMLTATVPAGLTVLQALERQADVGTRYGGRYVQSVEGIEGGLTEQQDWFYFVNGIEPDVGATEIRLRPGDVAWWDFRSWAEQMAAPVVVGAFPEPFLHGFDGHVRAVEVRAPAELADAAAALEELLVSSSSATGEPNVFVLEVREGATGATLAAERGQANDAPVRFTLSGSLSAVRAAALELARAPATVRFRYTAEFDEQGRLLP
jgi:hypothetical protein